MDEMDKKIKVVWDKIKMQTSITKSGNCPDDKLLLHYTEGLLSESEKEKMEQHLLACDYCLNHIVVYEKLKQESLLQVPETPKAWIEKVVKMLPGKSVGEDVFDIVIKFAKEAIEIIKNPGNLIIAQGPAAVSVRGEAGVLSTDYITLSKYFPGVNTEIEIEQTDSSHVNIRIIATDKGSGTPVQSLRASLFDPFEETASFVFKDGEVAFNEMKLGRYIIKFMKRGEKTGEVSLDLRK
jgi:hypothetical protein